MVSPLVSVIIPCYRQACFLPHAIESALAQTHAKMEVVVVDDGSPDNAAEIAGRYPKVSCVRQINRGLAEARNAGFRASRGEYVLFLDADDRLSSQAVEKHLGCFTQVPEAGFVVGDIDHMTREGFYAGSPRWPILKGDYYEELLRVNHVANTIAVMFRRAVIERVGGFKPSCSPAEDYELLLHAARLFPSAHHRTLVAQYRRHPATLSRQGGVMLRAMHRVMEMQRPIAEENPRLMEAWREGDLYWRDHFGTTTIKGVWNSFFRLDILGVLSGIGALVRYVRGRTFVIPWKYRRRLRKVFFRRGTMRRSGQGNTNRQSGDHQAPRLRD